MRVHCRTNLDIWQSEVFPTELPAVPRIGDKITSSTKWGSFRLKLEVIDVTWDYLDVCGYWMPVIELHIPNGFSISDFKLWYRKNTEI